MTNTPKEATDEGLECTECDKGTLYKGKDGNLYCANGYCNSNILINEFVEKGADLEHDRWARWQKYLHSKCRDIDHETDMPLCQCNPKKEAFQNGNMVILHNRDLVIPSELVERWERQISTKYADLSESEKESDREETRNYLPLLRTALSRSHAAGYAAGQREERERVDSECANLKGKN